MKKLFIVLAVAASITACNDSANSTDNQKDSLDSVASEKKEMIDSAADQRKDAIDSNTAAKKEALDKIDSLNRKDSIK